MKRIISLLLSVVLLVGLVTVGAVPVSAESTFTASEELIEMLKAMEGFDLYPRWDYMQWTVGYGTACPSEDLERYRANGITEEEADALLRDKLESFGKSVNSFNDKYSLGFTQNQFDAILLFTYNMGHAWMFQNGTFRQSLIDGDTGNDLMFTICKWSHAGGQILVPLIKRRLIEYNMFVNGVYSRTVPDNYCYVIYEMNGGTGETDVQGYDSSVTDTPRVTPTKDGYTFAGWYTANVGGTKVEVLDASVKNMTLYARWVVGDDVVVEDQPAEEETEAMDPVTVTVTASDVNIRSGAGTNYSILGQASKGQQLTITEVQAGSGYTWGKFDGGWIALMYTNYQEVMAQPPVTTEPDVTEPEATEPPATEPEATEPEATEPEATEPESNGVTVTVTATDVNVRTGPGTNYSIVTQADKGDQLVITETASGSGYTWGKFDGGWIALTYTNYSTVGNQNSGSTASVMGTVTGSDLNIRSGAGTNYSILGQMQKGDRVEILEQKTVGSMVWGKTEKGWISLTYVKLDSTTTEETPKQEETTTPAQTQMGTVVVDEFLRIRGGAGTGYSVVGYLGPNDRVEILETKTSGSITWGRISSGWISMDYVVLDGADTTTDTTPSTTQTKTITADCLRVRSGAGLSNTIVGYLYYGTKVEILETKTVDGMTWGRISTGWISMDYVS